MGKQKKGIYFDYHRQAWVLNGRYIKCGHPDEMNCTCYGKLHEGEEAIPEERRMEKNG